LRQLRLKKFYKIGPDWLMRVYHDITPNDILRKELIEPIEDFYPHVDFCYIPDIKTFGDLTGFYHRHLMELYHPLDGNIREY
jgi:hypothetical protein